MHIGEWAPPWVISWKSSIGSFQGPYKGHAQLQALPHSRRPRAGTSPEDLTVTSSSSQSRLRFPGRFYAKGCGPGNTANLSQVSRETASEFTEGRFALREEQGLARHLSTPSHAPLKKGEGQAPQDGWAVWRRSRVQGPQA